MYTTTADLDTLTGTTGDTTAKQQAVDSAEALFNLMCQSGTGLLSSAKTEYHECFDESKPPAKRYNTFYLRTYGPTSLTKIDGKTPVELGITYTLRGNVLRLSKDVSIPASFPYETALEYVSGAATIPSDVKSAVLHLAASFYALRKAHGIESYKQDLLSVTYDKTSGPVMNALDPQARDFVTATALAYTVAETFS